MTYFVVTDGDKAITYMCIVGTDAINAMTYLVCADGEDDVVDLDLVADLLSHLVEPQLERVERLTIRHVIDQQRALCVFVELVAHL